GPTPRSPTSPRSRRGCARLARRQHRLEDPAELVAVRPRVGAPDVDELARELAVEKKGGQDVRFAPLAEPAEERRDDAARARLERRRAHEIGRHLGDVGRGANEDRLDRPQRPIAGAGAELAVDSLDEVRPVDLGPGVEHGAYALQALDVVL